MGWTALAIIGRPFVAVALFFTAAVIAHCVLKLVPHGTLRRILTRRLTIVPKSEAERKDWWPVILPLGFFALLMLALLYTDPARY
jgi:hypothetical protein